MKQLCFILLACSLVACAPTEESAATTATGRLEVHSSTDFETGQGQTHYYLVEGERRVRLRLDDAGDLTTGDRVVVTGQRLPAQRPGADDELAVATIAREPGSLPAARSALSSLGPKRLAIILFNFSNDGRQLQTRSTMEQWAFTTPGSSMKDELAFMSFGNISYSGTVEGWFTIPYQNSGCDYLRWGSHARALSNLSGYDQWAYVFPSTAACPWGGLAVVGGNELWINMEPAWSMETFNRKLIHELGHNYGMSHANSYDCPAGCMTTEYGDSFDLMGQGSAVTQFSSARKVALSWMPASKIQTVTSSGTYRVYPATSNFNSPTALRIERGAQDLYIDWAWQAGGAILRWSDGTLSSTSNIIAPNLNSSLYGWSLNGTEKHRDQGIKVAVETVAQTSSYADVRVHFATCGNGVCDTDFGESCSTCGLSECCGAQDPCLQNGSYYSYTTGQSTPLTTTNPVEGTFEVTMSCFGPYTWTLTSGSCPGGWSAYNNGRNLYCSLGSSSAVFNVTYNGQSRSVTFY